MKICKKRMCCLLFGMLCLNVMTSLHAAEEEDDDDRFPLGCQDVGYKKELKVLTLLPGAAGKRNSMYFVYNKLPRTVHLYHMHDGHSYFNAYLNHSIRAGKWAVFSTSDTKLKFICAIADKDPGYGKIVDCEDALSVCEYTKVKFGLNNRGNVWIVNSNTKNGAIREVVRYGIIPAY